MDNNAMSLFNSLLSNPDAMKNLKGIIGGMSDSKEVKSEDSGSVNMQENSFSNQNDMSFLTDFINQNKNSEMLRKISNAYNVYSDNSAPSVRLLEALSPYLSGKRISNLEKVKNVIRITNVFSELSKN